MRLVLDTNVVVSAAIDLIVSGDLPLRNLKSFHRIPIISAAEAVARVEQKMTGS